MSLFVPNNIARIIVAVTVASATVGIVPMIIVQEVGS
jgi:hypothetical protein